MSKKTTAEREAAMAKKLLSNADKMLDLIDESFIVKERGHRVRKMPTFRPEELTLGEVLGVGGFGVVYEISKISLDPEASPLAKKPTGGDGESAKATEDQGKNGSGDGNTKEGEEKKGNGGAEDSKLKERLEDLRLSNVSTATAGSIDSSMHDNLVHYEIHKARHVMERRCVRNGVARYALKKLHTSNLSELERARGKVDLAVEAKYLSVVWHPNISKWATD